MPAVRASAWTTLALKAACAVAALVVFAWIGRSVATSVVKEATSAMDGGAPPVVVAQLPIVPVAALPVVDAAAPVVIPAASAEVRATPDDPVFVNHASAEQLRRLPGVGPKRAEAIVALRQRIGHFQRLEDLLRVKGIGRATIRKWRPLVRLDAPSSDAGADAAP